MGDPVLKLAPANLEEFLRWESLQQERHEFVGGRVLAMVGASKRHHRVVGALRDRLAAHLAGSPCDVYDETIKLRVTDDIFYPDVMVSCDARDRDDEYLVEHPILVGEVLSPSTSQYDVTVKLEIYRRIPELREILVLNPDRSSAPLVRRSENGWILEDFQGSASLNLESVGLSLSLSELFKCPAACAVCLKGSPCGGRINGSQSGCLS